MLLKQKAAQEEVYIIQGFIACFAGIAVHGLIDAVVFVPAMSLIFMGYLALYCRVVSEHRAEISIKIEISSLQRLRAMELLNSKGILKLFWGKSTCEDKYKEKEGKAYQA